MRPKLPTTTVTAASVTTTAPILPTDAVTTTAVTATVSILPSSPSSSASSIVHMHNMSAGELASF